MKKIIVTGGAGFIGSALIRYLVAGHLAEVLNLDKLTYAGNPESLQEVAGSPLYHFEKLDICDAEGVSKLFAEMIFPDSYCSLLFRNDPKKFAKISLLSVPGALSV